MEKKWAKEYDCCVDCKKTEQKHQGLGKCKNCYSRHDYKRSDKAFKRMQEFHYKKKFNLTLEEINRMIKNQDGICPICKQKISNAKRKWHVDHNHTTGEVRGILCSSCNPGLGYFKDNIQILQSAIKYLKKNL